MKKIEQQDIDLNQMMKFQKALQAGTQEGTEEHSEAQFSIQDQIKGDKINEAIIRHIHRSIRIQ